MTDYKILSPANNNLKSKLTETLLIDWLVDDKTDQSLNTIKTAGERKTFAQACW